MSFAAFNSFACKCKAVYEAWSVLTGDTFSIESFVKLAGAPTNSLDEFTITDVFNSGQYLFSMSVGNHKFLVCQDDTHLSVARYNTITGTNNWEQRSTNLINTGLLNRYGFYAWGMSPGNSSVSQFCCNDSQVWSIATSELFASTGITATAAPNTSTNEFDGESAEWGINLFSSHDYPTLICSRRYYHNATLTYVDTTELFPDLFWQHRYNIEYSETVEVGIGQWNASTGLAESVSTIYTKTVGREDVRGIVSGSETPPEGLEFDDFVTPGFFPPHDRLARPTNIVFSSVNSGSSYIAAFRMREFDDTGAIDNQKVLVIINGVTAIDDDYAPGFPNLYPAFQTCGYVHSTPNTSGYAHALLTYREGDNGDDKFAGYSAAGVELFDQTLSHFGMIRSVCDGWVWLATAIDIANELPPDGRDWSNVTTTETDDYIGNWMVRLDNGEWEPFREEISPTTWDYNGAITHQNGVSIFANIRATAHDLVKQVSHPYGPPLTTYGTTPP